MWCYKKAFYILLFLLVIISVYFLILDKPYQLLKVNQNSIQRLNRSTGESKVYDANDNIPSVQEELKLERQKEEASKWHFLQEGLLVRWNEEDSTLRTYIFVPKNEPVSKKLTLQIWDEDGFALSTSVYSQGDYLSTEIEKKDFFCGERHCFLLALISYVDYEIYKRIGSASLSNSSNEQVDFSDADEGIDKFLVNLKEASSAKSPK
jgi:cell division protein FtsL